MTENLDLIRVQANRVLSRYAMVWIWSVLFGTGAGSFFVYTSLARGGGWRGGDLLIGALALFAGVMGLLSLVQLLRFLRRYLIPVLLDPEQGERSFYDGARLLSQAVALLIYSLALGLCGTLAQFALGALR